MTIDYFRRLRAREKRSNEPPREEGNNKSRSRHSHPARAPGVSADIMACVGFSHDVPRGRDVPATGSVHTPPDSAYLGALPKPPTPRYD